MTKERFERVWDLTEEQAKRIVNRLLIEEVFPSNCDCNADCLWNEGCSRTEEDCRNRILDALLAQECGKEATHDEG